MKHQQILAWAAALVLCAGSLCAQEAPTRRMRMNRMAQQQQTDAQDQEGALDDASVKALNWRSIGPATMGGRITSLAVYEKDSSMWWAATAAGGLLKTVNNGTTFEHQFQNEKVCSIGDVAVCQSDPNILYVGTGEGNPRNSVSFGNGVYKSVDGGKSWQHIGLNGTFQISSVRIHPDNPDVVYVGALGRLWGPNERRGLFKTVDGGKTWDKIHYINEETGVIDIQMHPTDPDTLLVATYERRRDGFDGNAPVKKWGEGTGLYKTTDGGKTFSKITRGMPTCKIGRIGLEYYRKDPNTVYMIMETEKIGKEPANAPYLGITGENADVGARLTTVVKGGPAEKAGLMKDDIILRIGEKTVHSYNDLLAESRRIGAGVTVTLEVARDKKSLTVPMQIANKPKPRENARSNQRGGRRGGGRNAATRNPFSVRLGGQAANLQGQQGGKNEEEYGGLYKSTDGGDSWTRINSVNPRPMYFSEVRVDPSDNNHLWMAGVSLHRSVDGGETVTPDGAGRGVHVDHHALWIDPTDGRRMILGNDGGVYLTQDRGKNWDHLNHVAIGQFYHVTVGPRRNYKVYGGLQDNGSWGGPSRVRDGSGPINEDWIRIGGGDGFVCRVDADDPDQIYYESQNGGLGRRNLRTGTRGSNRPRPPRAGRGQGGARAQGEGRGGQRGGRGAGGARESYRFNWRTPFILSAHNSRIFYTAGNKVFRSYDKGNNIEAISPEITATDRGSATALAESPRDPKVLYVGTDDGAFWRTQDGGHTWDNLFLDAGMAKKAETAKAEKAVSEKGEEKPAEETAAVTAAGREAAAPGERAMRRGNRGRRGGRRGMGGRTARAGGTSKSNLSGLLPGRRWVSEIVASKYRTGRVYATFDAHRSDDDMPYPVKSEDFGETWESIRGDLPDEAGPTRTIAEDITNPNILYLGCEFGAYVSIDRGHHWTRMNNNLPTVPVHAFAQHEEAGELVAGTHGRSIWILDVSGLRQVSPKSLAADATLYQPKTAILWRSNPSRGGTIRRFVGQNPSSGATIYYSLGKKAREVVLTIKDQAGKELAKLETSVEKGLHMASWNLRGAAPTRMTDGRQIPARFRRRGGARVKPGTFVAELTVDGKTSTKSFQVEIDPENREQTWLDEEFEGELQEAMEGEEEEGGDEGDEEIVH